MIDALTDPKLLRRCLRGATQNANESINSVVWSILPKSKYHGYRSIRGAAAISSLYFNRGRSGLIKRGFLSIPRNRGTGKILDFRFYTFIVISIIENPEIHIFSAFDSADEKIPWTPLTSTHQTKVKTLRYKDEFF